MCFFFFNDTATTEIYTLSLHDALPIYLPDVGHASRRRASEIDGRGQVSIALAVDDGERQPPPRFVTRGRGVEELERPEIRDVVDAADARRLLRRRQIVGLAGDVDVERDGLHVLGVEAERGIDGLERYPLRVSEDRGDGGDELGEVRDPHLAAVTDEPVQVRGDRQRVPEIVALLEPADPILVAARPVPHVPLVERDVNRMRDRKSVV